MAKNIPDYSKANNSNQLLALLKQNVKYTLLVVNPKNPNAKPKVLPCQSDCISMTVVSQNGVELKYSIRHGNTLIDYTKFLGTMNISYLEDQYNKNKLTKSIDDQGRTVYGMI